LKPNPGNDTLSIMFAHIHQNVTEILGILPEHVTLVAAGKTRRPEELQAAADAGVCIIGHNYVQEAQAAVDALGRPVRWHMIGHLQRNKAKLAVELFDMVETVDSLRLARALDKAAGEAGKRLPVLIEVNSGREDNKHGAEPNSVKQLAQDICECQHLELQGLMTMGPFLEEAESMRPYFQLTRELFDGLRGMNLPGADLQFLSMGMSDSYAVAIEEGANLVRIGTSLFGARA